MKKIISFTFLSLCIATQSIAMDRVASNQKSRNGHLARETESPTTPRAILQERKVKQKQNALKISQERKKKYSDDDCNK